MHELPFAKSIFKSVVEAADANGARQVRRVELEVGVLRDFIPSLVQKYWDYVTAGSIAEGSVITMTEIPATARCHKCGHVYTFTLPELPTAHCPECGYDKGELLTGRELRIMNIEII